MTQARKYHQPGSEAELELECLSYSSEAAGHTHTHIQGTVSN